MALLLWTLVAAPLVLGGLLTLAGRRADPLAAVVGVGAAATTLGLAVAAAVARPSASTPFLAGIPFGLRVDGLSAVLVVTVATILLAVLVVAAGEFGAHEAPARFHGLMLLFAGAMLVTVTATDLLGLLMAWEVMGATSYALIGFWWHEQDRVESAQVAFLTTRTADVGLYVAAGAALAGGVTGLELAGLATAQPGWRDAVAAGVVLAAAGKSAQLPFSFWLSRAMAGPSPVSALLHSATMVAAGAYLLLRLTELLAATRWADDLVAWLGALTALALAAVALVQRQLKQVLAASTCSQIGFMVLAAGTGGLTAGTAQLVAHAAVKSLLFLAAGVWLTALGTQDVYALRGAARQWPVVGASFGIGALTLAGLPPLSLWVTKDAVLAHALDRSPWLYVIGLAAAAVSAGYAARILVLLWAPLGSPVTRHNREMRSERRVSFAEQAPLPALAGAAVALAAFGLPTVQRRFAAAVGGEATAPVAWELTVSAALAVAAVWLTYLLLRPRLQEDVETSGQRRSAVVNWAAGWLGLATAARVLVVGPVMALARALDRADDHVLDGAVRAVGTATIAVASAADRSVERRIDGTVGAVTATTRRLGRLARMPETGQLHQYLAQAAVGLVVLATIVILLR